MYAWRALCKYLHANRPYIKPNCFSNSRKYPSNMRIHPLGPSCIQTFKASRISANGEFVELDIAIKNRPYPSILIKQRSASISRIRIRHRHQEHVVLLIDSAGNYRKTHKKAPLPLGFPHSPAASVWFFACE